PRRFIPDSEPPHAVLPLSLAYPAGLFLSCAKQPPPRIKELAHHPAMQTRPLRVPFVTCARRLERGYCPTIEVMAM
ncbi:hypothetical protein, partial [Pseudomonas aeruginosa]|uniref:hypothetical protein n=2 Tax=Pseudomonas aeruginosa TaxID=287 RepID=UPI001ABC8F5F